ncbi:MAG: hypothetical protein C0505_18685 [Leptothrix sp. (in: Bacteria)]|nr:hypothetical protein [Leptothrix sp. (in: b-proteobacteria)]
MPPDTRSAPAAGIADGERMRGRLMAQALGRLLDRARGAREVLPHLAALERGLHDGGTAVIDRVPRQGLTKLCSQLGSLPLPADDPPLHELLTRLMDALEGPASPPAPAAAAAPAKPPPARRLLPMRDDLPFDIEQTVVINEVSHSDFMRVAGGHTSIGSDDPPR